MAAAVEFSDDDFIKFVQEKNKIEKNIRLAEFTKYKELRPALSNSEIYNDIDRVSKMGAAYGHILYKNSDRYNELWNMLLDHLTTPIGKALSILRRNNIPRWDRIQIAAHTPSGGGRTKRSRRSRKHRKSKRRARR